MILRSTASQSSNIQYAALPWRSAEGAIEILLITTRTTKRWIVPKGWPMKGCTPAECAAHEALEEAGVMGEMAGQALGTFRYNKLRRSGDIVPCTVHVFAMKVTQQRTSWVEKRQRETRWCTPEEALARVTDPGLRRLIGKFAKAATPLHQAG